MGDLSTKDCLIQVGNDTQLFAADSDDFHTKRRLDLIDVKHISQLVCYNK